MNLIVRPVWSCSSAVIALAAVVALIDALEAVADGAPLVEEVKDEASGTLAAAVERRGGMQAAAHGARS